MTSASSDKCVILGGGGHSRVVIDALRASGVAEPWVILDSNPERWSSSVDAVPIRGGDDLLQTLFEEGIAGFVVGLGQGPREKLFARGLAAGLRAITVVHPRAIVASGVEIGSGVQIFAGAVVNAGAVLADNVVVNTGGIVEHDARVAAHASVASRACLLGGAIVGERAFVGAGSVILPGIRVGADAIVGAGAVVTKDVAPGQTVVGIPARTLT